MKLRLKKSTQLIMLLISLIACNQNPCKKANCKSTKKNHNVNLVYMPSDTISSVITTETILFKNNQVLQKDTLKMSTVGGTRFLSDNNLYELGNNAINRVTFKVYKNGVILRSFDYQVKTNCCEIIDLGGLDHLEIFD